MRASLVLACLIAGVNASAQGTKAPTKPDSTKAAATKAAATKAPDTKAGAKAPTVGPAPTAGTKADTKSDTKQAAGTKAPPPAAGTKQAALATPAAPPQGVVTIAPTIMRETFAYEVEARRDPFVSLLTSAELRPTVADLRLTGILYDESGRNSYATMRDLTTDALYRVTTGQVLGRMRIALIKRGVVIFSIEEFGQNRQDSLVLRDTTKARAK